MPPFQLERKPGTNIKKARAEPRAQLVLLYGSNYCIAKMHSDITRIRLYLFNAIDAPNLLERYRSYNVC